MLGGKISSAGDCMLRSGMEQGLGSRAIAAATWADMPVQRRLMLMRRLREHIADQSSQLAAVCNPHAGRTRRESLVAEVLPLADACQFLQRNARRILRPLHFGRRSGPWWLGALSGRIERRPWGRVLIIGPSNYPLLLPGVQVVQALVAGNEVMVKPGRGGRAAMMELGTLLEKSGLPASLFTVLPEDISSVDEALRAGVDKVVLTGSLSAGKAILQRLAHTVTPATLELSGCDAVFVLAGANVKIAARAIAFGLTFNRSATCMAPRRLFVHDSLAGPLEETLCELLRQVEPVTVPGGPSTAGAIIKESVKCGGRLVAGHLHEDGSIQCPCVLADATADMALMTADVMAPIAALVRFDRLDAAVKDADKCPYKLGASIFGPPDAARDLARRLPVGVITINDLIAPTAHPRVTLAARGTSGFGATRGAEGLLEMTTPVTIIERRGRWLPHLAPPLPSDENVLQAMLKIRHGGNMRVRCRAVLQFIKAVRNR